MTFSALNQNTSLFPYYQLVEDQTWSVAEEKKHYTVITERHLQALWLEQKYMRPLTTAAGLPIRVLSPGMWNMEAGPDFLKAQISIDGVILTGDVEIHLSQDGWHMHHHDTDPRYNNVILHVVLWQPKQLHGIRKANGLQTPQTFIEPVLTIPLQRIAQLIDLDLYPYKHYVGAGKCAHAIFRKLPAADAVEFFRSAAYFRWQMKAEKLQAYSSNENNQFLYGLAECLGYKRNAAAFVQLYERLHLYADRFDEDQLIALALQMFGFFGSRHQKKWQQSAQYQKYQSLLSSLPVSDLPAIELQLNQIRPHNHPIRRVVYLVKLIQDPASQTLLSLLHAQWLKLTAAGHLTKKQMMALWNDLQALLPAYYDDYWSFHYLFEDKVQKAPLALIGAPLRHEILINVFLPIAYMHLQSIDRHYDHQNALFQLYAHLKPSQNAKSKYLIHRFYGDHTKGRLLRHADTEQGAFQLHRDFCRHFEASCEGCPFIARFHALLPNTIS